MAKGKVEREFERIQFALESDELSPKERFALLTARHTMKWFVSFGQQKNVASPTDAIIPKFFEKTVASTDPE